MRKGKSLLTLLTTITLVLTIGTISGQLIEPAEEENREFVISKVFYQIYKHFELKSKSRNCLVMLKQINHHFEEEHRENEGENFSHKIEIKELITILKEQFKKVDTCDQHLHYIKFISYYKDSVDACQCEVYVRKLYSQIITLKKLSENENFGGDESQYEKEIDLYWGLFLKSCVKMNLYGDYWEEKLDFH